MLIQEFEIWGTDELNKRNVWLVTGNIASVQQLEERELRDFGTMTRTIKSYPPGCRVSMVGGADYILAGTAEDIVKKWMEGTE